MPYRGLYEVYRGRIPMSIGVEILNEEYLEGLRNGEEYDPY
jgi:hypothetical protein